MTNCQKESFFFFFFLRFFVLYTENVNAVGNITYKDNEHLAVKCIVLHSLGMDSVLFEKMVNDMVSDYTFVVAMVTGVYLQLGTQCGDEERLEGRSPMRHTCLHHSTIRGVEDFDDTVRS